jgi:hypothetical protein
MNLSNPEGNPIMKNSILVATFIACALSAPIASAQDKAAPAKPAMSMEMDKPMPPMQENMKKMQQQMEKIQATTDPKERQALMQEHMQAMQECMKTMRGMSDPMMKDGGEHDGMAKSGHKKMTGDNMMRHHAMMEKRMDMMQMMMEQMLQHDQAMQSMPAK